ncbi:MAG: sugar ABC transporter ATP-binding protein [Planctomycetota bacterium]
MTATAAPLLALRGITKDFPGVRALDGVDFTLRSGEIHALLGENGAGKSTLIKVLTGIYAPDRDETGRRGEMRLAGRLIRPRSPLDAQALGISTVYQEINLIPHRSVAENLFLGRQPRRWFGGIHWGRINRAAEEALARLQVHIDVRQPLADHSIAIQQMVAIARALEPSQPGRIAGRKPSPPRQRWDHPSPARQRWDNLERSGTARVLILDEPTSSLDAAEVEQLFAVMRRLKAAGLGIIFITHFLEQVYAISDRLTVLRNGRLVGKYETGCLPRLELIGKMIGKEAAELAQRTPRAAAGTAATDGAAAPGPAISTAPAGGAAPPLLSARGLGRRGAIAPFELDLREGEVVGLAGLLGSGRTEMARLLFGLDRADAGGLFIAGRALFPLNPRRAIAHGQGFCPEDRKTDGLVPSLSVRENIVLALQARRGWMRTLSRRAQVHLADGYIRALNIATPDAEKTVSELSGGNQQKVILARWLAARPRLLILDEPTRGIDIGAKAEIEKLVAELRAAGMGVLFISSELEEVVRNCQRIAILRDRRKIGELAGADIELSAILRRIAAASAVTAAETVAESQGTP